LTANYQWGQSNLLDLDDSIRAELPGDFVELEDGVLSYYLRGSDQGEKVVLVHGFSTPKFVWDSNVGPLTEAGYRVLAYDHYGRGLSDRPDITYDTHLYTRELLNLLDALDITEPVTLVGYSMGGGNVIGFAAAHPNRVKKLILIAPIGFMPEPSGLTRLVTLPGIGELLMDMNFRESLSAAIDKEVAAGNAMASIQENFVEQLRYKGYVPALLSTLRNYPMSDLSDDYEKVGTSDIPVFAIWGTADAVVPFSGAEQAQQAIPTMELFPVKGAEHSVTYAQADVVNEILLDVLAR
jgi:pimeloyl-ACP methyl ester carboxylesterase